MGRALYVRSQSCWETSGPTLRNEHVEYLSVMQFIIQNIKNTALYLEAELIKILITSCLSVCLSHVIITLFNLFK